VQAFASALVWEVLLHGPDVFSVVIIVALSASGPRGHVL
jgi:hypothetical protein